MFGSDAFEPASVKVEPRHGQPVECSRSQFSKMTTRFSCSVPSTLDQKLEQQLRQITSASDRILARKKKILVKKEEDLPKQLEKRQRKRDWVREFAAAPAAENILDAAEASVEVAAKVEHDIVSEKAVPVPEVEDPFTTWLDGVCKAREDAAAIKSCVLAVSDTMSTEEKTIFQMSCDAVPPGELVDAVQNLSKERKQQQRKQQQDSKERKLLTYWEDPVNAGRLASHSGKRKRCKPAVASTFEAVLTVPKHAKKSPVRAPLELHVGTAVSVRWGKGNGQKLFPAQIVELGKSQYWVKFDGDGTRARVCAAAVTAVESVVAEQCVTPQPCTTPTNIAAVFSEPKPRVAVKRSMISPGDAKMLSNKHLLRRINLSIDQAVREGKLSTIMQFFTEAHDDCPDAAHSAAEAAKLLAVEFKHRASGVTEMTNGYKFSICW